MNGPRKAALAAVRGRAVIAVYIRMRQATLSKWRMPVAILTAAKVGAKFDRSMICLLSPNVALRRSTDSPFKLVAYNYWGAKPRPNNRYSTKTAIELGAQDVLYLSISTRFPINSAVHLPKSLSVQLEFPPLGINVPSLQNSPNRHI